MSHTPALMAGGRRRQVRGGAEKIITCHDGLPSPATDIIDDVLHTIFLWHEKYQYNVC